jgi:hypothetical protein
MQEMKTKQYEEFLKQMNNAEKGWNSWAIRYIY